MKLSVIIPVYNAGKFLSTCLDSLLSQDIEISDYEILIINDGSKDNSLFIARTYSDKYKHIKVYSQENNGVGSARNKGIDIAQGKYIYFIDPDDYLIIHTLRELVNRIELNNLDILTFGSTQVFKSDLNEDRMVNKAILSKIYDGIDYIANYRCKNEVWWYLIEREFLLNSKIRFIEDRWMEDAIFTTNLFIEASKIASFSLDAHRHITVEGSAMTNRDPKHYIGVIDDNRNAAIVFETIIEELKQKNVNPNCIKRLIVRQQSFVFFMMIRMLKSTMTLKQIRLVIDELANTNAYPFNLFPGIDYKGMQYVLLCRIFNHKKIFYLLFKLFNPLIKLVNNVKWSFYQF